MPPEELRVVVHRALLPYHQDMALRQLRGGHVEGLKYIKYIYVYLHI